VEFTEDPRSLFVLISDVLLCTDDFDDSIVLENRFAMSAHSTDVATESGDTSLDVEGIAAVCSLFYSRTDFFPIL
jgi:hypothetical protein